VPEYNLGINDVYVKQRHLLMNILVTGAAGFIGAALSERLLDRGDSIVGIDNLNDYYDVALKQARLKRLEKHALFEFEKIDIADPEAISIFFEKHTFDVVVNLAAQAGVRYSVENPLAYVDANLTGFGNVLEGCRHGGVKHLVYASSSSVYGANTKLPFAETDHVDHPLSFYGATKKANEMMAHAFAHVYALPCTGLRFFTVYGPWGRPDMALFKFTNAILNGEPIPIYNKGQMVRDFTYIDDIVTGVVNVIDNPAVADPEWDSNIPNPATSTAPYRVFNIGNSQPVELMAYIDLIEKHLGCEAKKEFLPRPPEDLLQTHADVSGLKKHFAYAPSTPVDVGIGRFVEWYKNFYATV